MTKPLSIQKRAVDLVITMMGAVQSQLKKAVSAFIGRDEKQALAVIEKDDFIDNLYVFTESELFTMLEEGPGENADLIRTALKIAKGLEKIADYSENVAKQTLHLLPGHDKSLSIDILGCYQEASKGIQLAVDGFIHRDIKCIKRAAKTESILDDVYLDIVSKTNTQLTKPNQEVGFLITQLLLAKYLEKIGDTILDMAEAGLALISGERLKIHQYIHLSRLVKKGAVDETELEGFWGTRSGSSIFRLDSKGEERLIYKEGPPKKIRQEMDKLKQWESIQPGLVPKLISSEKTGERQIMVTQYIDGTPYCDLYSRPWWREKQDATERLIHTMDHLWKKTKTQRSPAFDLISQIRERLDAVHSMHPYLRRMCNRPIRFCNIEHPTLPDILDRLETHEKKFRSPFSVFIHGDFNCDNILFCRNSNTLHFIDVNRSRKGDYLQDISVFMVSIIRTPAFSGRQLLEFERINLMVEAFARRFAKKHGDNRFEERLNLFLGRSLITSARFVGDRIHARRLYLSGVEKLGRVLEQVENEDRLQKP